MKVRFSRQSHVDLLNITGNIAKDNPARADSFADELEAASLALSDMPKAFRVLTGRDGREVHLKPHGKYVIIYRVTERNVDILRIIHGARNYRGAFTRKE
ncbi:type II toxin-antitoxin system RelE/ParE family toxin [Neorhizobium sp. NCHU2750]|uniref:type II toxin-antitoxin system RelE/ParE family toxin n=1 Tax=Neorhizobium sp. NCHU2750 TaxID=1825976 RepID=UPI000E72187A|nr:plasmid stabilization protein [Neorhizobium sp. NCHU2750]